MNYYRILLNNPPPLYENVFWSQRGPFSTFNLKTLRHNIKGANPSLVNYVVQLSTIETFVSHELKLRLKIIETFSKKRKRKNRLKIKIKCLASKILLILADAKCVICFKK